VRRDDGEGTLSLELTSAELFDCHGRVTHTLVLLVDGNVEIRFHSGRIASPP
jgi:hypothetical protein